MRYVEYPPPPGLAPLVECAWFLDGGPAGAASAVERIVPDGCAEIIVQCGDVFQRLDTGGGLLEVQPRSFLAGVLTRFWIVQPTGAVRTMGVRLRPGAVGALFGVPAAELSDRATPLDAIWGWDAVELEERVMVAPDDHSRLTAVWTFLASRATVQLRPDPVVFVAVRTVIRSQGRIRLGALAKACALSPRQLERRFREAIGTGPKTLSRIVRFQVLLKNIKTSSGTPWTDLALAAGFYDQAHLIRDFRAFTGQTPSRFVADEGVLSRCFASPERLATLMDA